MQQQISKPFSFVFFSFLQLIRSTMVELLFIVGVIGNIISVLMFLSPLMTFWRIVENRSTEEFESLPYICTLLNTSLWTYYGIIKPRAYLVATVNGFGTVVEIIYVFLFLLFAPPFHKGKTAILFGILNVGFLAAVLCVTYFLFDGEMKVNATGYMASGLNIIMYGSPLVAMKRVVMAKSVEYMPFLLSFFLLLNGGIWTSYAFLAQDWFLGVPNVIGLLLGALQLVLYAVYKNPKSSKDKGRLSQRLLPSSSSEAKHNTIVEP